MKLGGVTISWCWPSECLGLDTWVYWDCRGYIRFFGIEFDWEPGK